MKKKKVLLIISFLIMPLIILAVFLNKAYSANATISFKDWGSVRTIENDYSYSTVFLTSNTRFLVYRNGDTVTSNPERLTYSEYRNKYTVANENSNSSKGRVTITPGKKFIMLITNCGVNANGEVLDLLVSVDDVKGFTNVNKLSNVTPYVYFTISTGYGIPNSQLDPCYTDACAGTDKMNPKNGQYYRVETNTPLVFGFDTHYAKATFNMTYYKTGTYGNTNILGGINKINGFYWDIDVLANKFSNPELWTNELFDGNEGISPNLGDTVVYYNKSKTHIKNTVGDYTHILDEYTQAEDGEIGIAIKSSNANTDYIYYESSAFMTTSGLNDSKFSFTYSGVSCGIQYIFASPYPYQISNPTKKAILPNNISAVRPSDSSRNSFKYVISQYIPNNYYGTLLSYSEIYNNLYGTTRYSNLVISDTIDSNLLPGDVASIVITNELGTNVTNYFNIAVSGNYISAAVKPEYFENRAFYAHTYNIEIPVTVKSTTSNVAQICNYTNNGNTTSTIDSDTTNLSLNKNVCVPVEYALIVNYYENGTTNPVVASDGPTYYSYNASYNTSPDKGKSNVWEYANSYGSVPGNLPTSGNITQDTVINYYFEKHKYTLTVNYLEEGTGRPLGISPTIETVRYDDPYDTTSYYLDGNKTGINYDEWMYAEKTDGAAPAGVIYGDTTVNYYFKKRPYTLTVNYLDADTHEKIDNLGPDVTNPVYYNENHNTDYNKVNLKKWYIVDADTTAAENSENPDTHIISVNIKNDTTVNYYFRKIPYTLTVNYYEKGTKNRIDNLEADITNPIYYDDHYSTNYNKVNLKKWRIVSSEVNIKEDSVTSEGTKIISGTLRGDTIVDYYFEKIPYTLTVNYYGTDQFGSTSVIEEAKVTYPIYYDDTYGPENNYGIDYKTTKINFKKWRIISSEVKPVEESKYTKDEITKIVTGTILGDTVVNYYFELIPYPVTVNYYDIQSREKIAETDKTIYYYDMLYYTDYDKINMDVWEYASTDGDPIKGRITGDQKSYTINYYFNRLKYELVVNYYDDETKEKIAKSDRASYNYGDEYDTNYDKIDENYWEYVRTEGETPGVINEDKEIDYYFNNKEYTLEVNYYDEETGEKIDETEVSSHKFGDEYTTNDDKIDKKKWELVEEPENKEGTVEDDTTVNYYYRRRKYKITVNYYEEGTENKIIDSSVSEAYYGDKYITDYNGVDEDVWTLVGMPENYQGEVDGDIIVNYYFKQVVIENPPTGVTAIKIIVPSIVLIAIITLTIIGYRIVRKRRIYKI